MNENSKAKQSNMDYQCTACLKPLHPGATVCPYCLSRQHTSKWHTVSLTLQWSAGAVAIISLVVALHSLINLYSGWLEQKHTVNELAQAARLLEQAHNYYYAWDLTEQALALDPNSPKLRRYQMELAMQWLRNTRGIQKLSYSTMADTVTPVLYRALNSLENETAATVFAHIGFAQYLKSRDTAVLTDIDALFKRALELDGSNTYANVFRGFWLIFTTKSEHYQEAIQHFETASNDKHQQAWVREWYLYALNLLVDTSDPTILADSGKRMLVLANDSRINNQMLYGWRLRSNIVRHFGAFRTVSPYVEELLDTLPPQQTIATLNWLIKDLQTSKTLGAQYALARLNEKTGNSQQALTIYETLLENKPRKELHKLISEAYVRITGHPPAQDSKRDYMNDPIPSTGDLWRFHADSLLKFDFLWQPSNFTAALRYFAPEPENPHLEDRLPKTLAVFARTRDRIKEWVDARERLILSGYQHPYRNKAEEYISKNNLYKVMFHYGKLAYLNGSWDTAITALKDMMAHRGQGDADTWYWLARAHSQRAQNTHDPELKKHDIKAALTALQKHVDVLIADKKNIDWQRIKTDSALEVVRPQDAYQRLIRGR
jgi:tetratricopeptide (TPR) repeat protein